MLSASEASLPSPLPPPSEAPSPRPLFSLLDDMSSSSSASASAGKGRCPMGVIARIVDFLGTGGILPFLSNAKNWKRQGHNILVFRRLPYLLVNVVIPELLAVAWAVTFVLDKSVIDIFLDNRTEIQGYPEFFKGIMVVSIMLLLQMNVIMAVFFAASIKKLEELNDELASKLLPIPESATKVFQRKMLKFTAVHLTRSALYVLVLVASFLALDMIRDDHPGIFVFFIASCLFGYSPLCLTGCEVVVKAHFEFLQLHLRRLKESLAKDKIGASIPVAGKDVPPGVASAAGDVTDHGLILCQCIRKFDKSLGRILLIQTGIYTINEIFFLYFLSLSYNIFKNATMAVLIYGLSGTLVIGNNTWQKFHLFRLSQNVTWLMKKCREKLVERRISDLFWQLSQSYKLDLLQSELGNREPVR